MTQNLYSKITDALVENGYIVIENAFGSELSNKLLNLAKSETDFKKAGISSSSDLHVDSDRRRDKIHWLDEDNSIQSKFLGLTKELQNYLNRELYLGLTYYESHFAIYDKGDFYEKHLDAFKGNKNRIVTTVYYLNDEWSDTDGGELIIYDEDNNYITTVMPKANTLVVFMSDRFPHEVKPANKKRYSIAGWFRVDKS